MYENMKAQKWEPFCSLLSFKELHVEGHGLSSHRTSDRDLTMLWRSPQGGGVSPLPTGKTVHSIWLEHRFFFWIEWNKDSELVLIVLEVATPLTNIDDPKANILGQGRINNFFLMVGSPPTFFFLGGGRYFCGKFPYTKSLGPPPIKEKYPRNHLGGKNTNLFLGGIILPNYYYLRILIYIIIRRISIKQPVNGICFF